jgi:hypothetical protein
MAAASFSLGGSRKEAVGERAKNSLSVRLDAFVAP